MDYLALLVNQHVQSAHHVLLLDLNMLGIDGYRILQYIEKQEALHLLPVIVLSSSRDDTETQRCYELGCALYIIKPIDYQLFADTIRQLAGFLAIVRLPRISSATPRNNSGA